MATLVLLGGNTIHNKSWIQEVNQELLHFYDTTHVHNYRHWNQEGGTINLEYECEQLCKYLKTLSGSIILFCKSLGCILGLKAIVEQEIFIKQCIFVGFPLGYCERNGFSTEKYLKELTCPVLWIQKTNDPAGGYITIAEKLGSLSPAFTCKEISGDDHDYQEITLLKEIILDNNAR
ncbi:MAG: alpha/beta family hydrolase [Candidatus Absconditabacterales bacterium]